MSHDQPLHIYDLAASAVIYRMMDQFDDLSNFARDFPLEIHGLVAYTNESLYQALRFPHRPDLQRLLLEEPNPAKVKRISRDYLQDTRPNWETQRKDIMRWCLQIKLAQHRKRIGDLLLASGDRPIVEQAYADQYWGATLQEDGTLRGANVLGLLWMGLRAELHAGHWGPERTVEPLPIPDFVLDRRAIGSVRVIG
jgi:type I restriction enzyme, S subunit